MGLRAIRDTYGIERTGPDSEVRRKIAAGTEVPSHYYDFEDKGAVEPYDSGEPIPGIVDYQRPPGLKKGVAPEPIVNEDDVRRPETSGEPEGKVGHSGNAKRSGVARAQGK